MSTTLSPQLVPPSYHQSDLSLLFSNNPNRTFALKRNFSWTLAGNVVYAACQWGMLIAVAKLGTPEMVGQFALGLAVTAPICLFTNMQLRLVLATDAQGQYQTMGPIVLRLVTALISFTMVWGVVTVAGYRNETASIILVLGLAKASESVSDICHGVLQRDGRMDLIAKSLILKGILSLLILAFSVFFLGSVLWGSLGLALVWTAILLGYDAPRSAAICGVSLDLRRTFFFLTRCFGETFAIRENLKKLTRLIQFSLPLGFVAMLISLNVNIPRYFIERYQGIYELGIFSALSYLLVVGNTVMNALDQVTSPRLATQLVEHGVKAFQRLLLYLVGGGALLGCLGCLMVLLVGHQTLQFFYRPEYAAHQPDLLWLMIGGTFLYMSWPLNSSLIILRESSSQLILNISQTICVCGLSALLVPIYGAYGAAVTMALSASVFFFLKLLLVQRKIYRLSSLN